MGIISWIVLGAIVGAIAKLIMPGKDPGGIIVTILLGIAGAFVGGYIPQHHPTATIATRIPPTFVTATAARPP